MTTPQNELELKKLAEVLAELDKKHTYSKIDFLFPDQGPFSRDKYEKQISFFAHGRDHLVRAIVGGNGTGKSVLGAAELVYHLTGQYPTWWAGRRFKKPIRAWAAAIETKQLRSGIQEIIFGSYNDPGTGLLPRDALLDEKGSLQIWSMQGTANCVGQARVKHFTNGLHDGYSEIEFKTYEQGWANFQGATRDFIWLDEEPADPKVYTECLARTRGPKGKEGSVICTFTPLLGYSTVYLSFLPNGQLPPAGVNQETNSYTEIITWDDVPHLSEDWKKQQIAIYQMTDPNSIEARTRGIAAMGSGRVYPIDEAFVIVPKQQIPTFWRKAYGLDPGASNTAVIWIAQDPNTQVMYIYDEYKNGRVLYLLHGEAIKTRGDWIEGGIDPHEAVKPRDTGESVHTYFESLGLHLTAAKGDPDALRARIRALFESGALKIMDSCVGLVNEIRTYRYDLNDPNKIAKNQDDHRIDAMMYCIAVFESIAQSYAEVEEQIYTDRHSKRDDGDPNRSSYTGY